MPERIKHHRPNTIHIVSDADKASKAFLDSPAWKRCRRKKLEKNPLCQCSYGPDGGNCGELAECVHHIQPRELRPDLALSFSNLLSLTTSCHTRLENDLRKENDAELQRGYRGSKAGN